MIGTVFSLIGWGSRGIVPEIYADAKAEFKHYVKKYDDPKSSDEDRRRVERMFPYFVKESNFIESTIKEADKLERSIRQSMRDIDEGDMTEDERKSATKEVEEDYAGLLNIQQEAYIAIRNLREKIDADASKRIKVLETSMKALDKNSPLYEKYAEEKALLEAGIAQ